MGIGREEAAEAMAETDLYEMEEEQREKRQRINGIKLKLLTVKDPTAKEVLRDILNLISEMM